jgi:hypothetical protein
MAVNDTWRLRAQNARLTARAETSSGADPVLALINRRPSKFDGPGSRPSRMATDVAQTDAAFGGLPQGNDAPADERPTA